jgi:hypothetical protein
MVTNELREKKSLNLIDDYWPRFHLDFDTNSSLTKLNKISNFVCQSLISIVRFVGWFETLEAAPKFFDLWI